MVNKISRRFCVGRSLAWIVIIALSAVLILATSGAQHLTFTTDFRSYFSSENPQLRAFEQLEADFNKQDTLVFLVEMEDEQSSVLNPHGLGFLKALTRSAWQIPFARRVDSLINYQRIESTEDELIVNDLVPADTKITNNDIAQLSQYIQQQPRLLNNFISADESLALVVVSLALPDGDEQATKMLVADAKARLEDLNHEGISIKLFGSTIINLALAEAVERDIALLIPLSYLIIFSAIFFLTRSLAGTLLALLMTLLSVSSVFGVFGWMGMPLTPVVGAVPSMIMIIVIADCMHILVSFQHYLKQGFEKTEAITEAVRINIKPVMITSITTALGLLCLNFSESPPYRDLGNLVAMAAIIAGALALTWFPACLFIFSGSKGPKESDHNVLETFFNQISGWIFNYPQQIVAASIFSIVIALIGIMQLEFNEQWHQYYDETYDVRQALDTQNDKLYGVNFIQYSVGSGESEGIYRVAYQKQLDQLVSWIDQQENVGYVDALSLQVKELNQKLQANDLQTFRIPDSREVIAQSLLAYEMSLPLGMGMDQYVNIDRSSTRLTVYLHKSTSKQLISMDEKILSQAKVNYPMLHLESGTGLDMVFANISDSNSMSLLKGTGLALLLISIILILVLKSIRLGLVSIIPNIMPVVLAYGAWGFISGRIDLGLSIVACMSIGLVVDDTVHFLSKYQLARQQGKTTEQAIQYAFSTVGIAMLITTFVLAAGFLLLALSSFSPTHGMGALLALTAVFALIIDFLFLPILLITFDSSTKSNVNQH
ncbi:MAG: putative RND superfamily exporter protein [Oleispira sp.]|jgi:predicted RND superfamily exporter protein